MDASGNFSFDVLNTALKNSFGCELISWTCEQGRNQIDPENEIGFVINRHAHWYSLRKIEKQWWNLDSLIDKPENISHFYVNAYVAQLRNEGSSVFLVRGGSLPECGKYHYDPTEANPQALIWEESRLLGKASLNMTYSTTMNGDNDDDLMLALALSESMK